MGGPGKIPPEENIVWAKLQPGEYSSFLIIIFLGNFICFIYLFIFFFLQVILSSSKGDIRSIGEMVLFLMVTSLEFTFIIMLMRIMLVV